MRVRLEDEAMVALLSAVEVGNIKIVGSAVIDFELRQNPDQIRRAFGLEATKRASVFVSLSAEIISRARKFLPAGIRPRDALHLASAEAVDANYFCTCDDNLMNRGKLLKDYKLHIVTPVELIGELK